VCAALAAVLVAVATPLHAQPLPADFIERAEVAPIEIVLPRDADAEWAPRPLIVALHGYGSKPDDLLPAFRALASRVGAVLAVPRAVDPAGNGFTWDTPAKADFVVMRAIERARRRAPIQPGRIVLAGFSQGASMAYHVALRHPELFKGVMPMAGRYDEAVTPIPSPAPKRWPRFAILCGSEDQGVEHSRRAAKLLEAAGVPVTLKIWEGVGHRVPQDGLPDLQAAVDALLR
jgi:phospholipase/carboxylesterase